MPQLQPYRMIIDCRNEDGRKSRAVCAQNVGVDLIAHERGLGWLQIKSREAFADALLKRLFCACDAVQAVLGGIGSIPGAMVGGFCIGLLEALVAAVGLSVWKDAVVFAILIVVLLVKPSGIMGHPVTEKV